MIEYGLLVFFGVLLILIKLPSPWLLRLLGHSLALDLAVSGLTLVIHWGTFSGVMAASIAGLMTSIATGLLRRCIGYIKDGHYHRGVFSLIH